MFYKLKIAFNNTKSNKRTYLPLLFTSVMTFLLLSSIYTLSNHPNLRHIRGGRSLTALFGIGIPVFLFFFFLLYINVSRFVFKFRSKSYGLYHVLGFSKKDIALVYILEVLIVLAFSILIAFPLAELCNRGALWFFQELVDQEVLLTYQFSLTAFSKSILSLLSLSIGSSLFVIYSIYKLNSMDLLKESESGEQPPKYNLVFALIGILLLIGTYLYANSINMNFLSSSNIFKLFISIIAAIIATYLIFMSSSIFILDRLRKNRHLYYRPKAMVIISNLYFRMKKNAFGLASVTILSTMAIFTLAITSILYFNMYRELPLPDADMSFGIYSTRDESFESVNQEVVESLENLNIGYQLKSEKSIDLMYYTDFKEEHPFTIQLIRPNNLTYEVYHGSFYFLKLSNYNQWFNSKLQLNDNQMILITANYIKDSGINRVKIFDELFHIVKFSDRLVKEDFLHQDIIILNDNQFDQVTNSFRELVADQEGYDNRIYPYRIHYFNIMDDQGKRVTENDYYKFKHHFDFDSDIWRNELNFENEEIRYMFAHNRIDREHTRVVFVSLLMVGFIFVIIFILNLFSTLYFKYYQEALEDRKQFKTLQQVGLSEKESKRTLSYQISFVYFLPLLFSLLHIFFARKGIYTIQRMFNLSAQSMSELLSPEELAIQKISILLTITVFVVLYGVMYFVIRQLAYQLVSSSEEIQ